MADRRQPQSVSAPSRKLEEKRARRKAREARKKRGRDWTRTIYLSLIGMIALSLLVFMAYTSTHPEKTIQPAVGAKQNVGEKMELEAADHMRGDGACLWITGSQPKLRTSTRRM